VPIRVLVEKGVIASASDVDRTLVFPATSADPNQYNKDHLDCPFLRLPPASQTTASGARAGRTSNGTISGQGRLTTLSQGTEAAGGSSRAGVLSVDSGFAHSIPTVPCPTNLNSCTANDMVTDVVAVGILNNDICQSLDDTIDLEMTVSFSATS